jgi:hypothetical protein
MQHVTVSLQLYNVDRQHNYHDQHFVKVLTTTFQEIRAHDIVQRGLYEEVHHKILGSIVLPMGNYAS